MLICKFPLQANNNQLIILYLKNKKLRLPKKVIKTILVPKIYCKA